MGIQYESEKRERKKRNEMNSHSLTAKMISFWQKNEKAPNSVGGMVMAEAPAVYVTDLPYFLNTLLDDYSEAGLFDPK